MNSYKLTRALPTRARRPRKARLAVEAMEQRLALSQTLPLPPPAVASLVANYPSGPAIPTGPCIPSGPCIPTGLCVANGPPASQFSSDYPQGPVHGLLPGSYPTGPLT
jgi:hypothetical protein